jgi:hypothetical protein
MTSIPRRQIDELVALHEREPALRDVIVEGITDKQLFEWFLAESGLQGVSVYDVSTVDIPDKLVIDAGLETGARGRVIALAGALADKNPARDHITCIADADFDFIENINRESPALLITDFTSVELYAFNDVSVNKILKLVLKGFTKSAATVLKQLATPLQEIFLLRAANHVGKLGLDFDTPNSAGFYKSLRLKGEILEFDSERYLTGLLQARGATAKRGQVIGTVAQLRLAQREDPRFQIHGHDFEHVFALYVRKHKGFGGIHPETIICAILAALDLELLRQQKLFQYLAERCSFDSHRKS